MKMIAKSEQHAREIFDDLISKGYKYRLSINYIQEWVHESKESVFVLKGYGYRRIMNVY